MTRWVLLAFVLFRPGVGIVHAVPAPLSYGTYRAVVHAARLQLDGLTRENRAGYQQVRTELRSLARVRLRDGFVVATSCPELAPRLKDGDTSSARPVAALLDALDSALGKARTAGARRSDHQALVRILADPRFHPSQNPLQMLTDWIGGQIDRFLGWLSNLLQRAAPGGGVGAWFDWLRAILVLGVFGVLVFMLGRLALARMVREATYTEPGSEDPVTSSAATELADRYAAEGEFRLAFRYAFVSAILRLQERGMLDLRPGTTNREYLRDLRRDPARWGALGPDMELLIEEFDRVWYGHYPYGADDYRRSAALLHRVGSPRAGAAA